jgi:hypothetical protein
MIMTMTMERPTAVADCCPPWCEVNDGISSHDSADGMPGWPGFDGVYQHRRDRSILYDGVRPEGWPEGCNLFIGVDITQEGSGKPRICLTNSVHEEPDDEWYLSLDEAGQLAAAILEQVAMARSAQ